MPGLLDLEDHFPPEKVEAVYAALTVDWPGDTRHNAAGAIADYLLKRPEVLAALPPVAPDGAGLDVWAMAGAIASVFPQLFAGDPGPQHLIGEAEQVVTMYRRLRAGEGGET